MEPLSSVKIDRGQFIANEINVTYSDKCYFYNLLHICAA